MEIFLALLICSAVLIQFILREHVIRIIDSQKAVKRLSVHYLSSDSQNEFISACAHQVRDVICKLFCIIT